MEGQVLDLTQLARIQGMHRGVLYQHLYATACLLTAPNTGIARVRVERDEDVELVREAQVVYAQVKTRGSPLSPSDIDGMLDRLDTVRAAHAQGVRPGTARFALVSNVELGPTLAGQAWPSDVLVATPTTPSQALRHTGLIVPPPTVAALLVELHQLAEGYRLSALRPESLIAKLVGVMAHAAAGEQGAGSFAVADLGRLCELIAAQIRPLPRVARYLPQGDEPVLPGGRGSLVVLGHAGDGKSSWAAEVAALTSDVAVYVACSSAVGEQVATRVVDATVSTLVARGDVKPYDLVLPGRTGIEALALLNEQLVARDVPVLVVLDDCHHTTSALLLEAMRAAPSVRWLLLGRPCDALAETVALMALPCEELRGWSDDVIARLLQEAKCSTRPAGVAALRSATNGAPLFVNHAIQAIRDAGLDTEEYARSLVAGTTTGRSAQELLLEGAIRALDIPTGRVASALAAIDASLRQDEWVNLVERAVGGNAAIVRRALRALVDRKIALESEGGVVSLHDAFRPLLDSRFVTDEESRRVKESAADLLREELLTERASERIIAYVRILASLGKLSDLADIANALSEWFRETGTINEVRGHLEASLRDGSLNADDRFWALDTLAFFDIENERTDEAAGRLPEMEQLVAQLDAHARGALLHKRALVAFSRGDIEEMRHLASAPAPTPAHGRILRYHAALGEARAGNILRAVRQLEELATEYLASLGLSPSIVLAKNPEDLRALMRSDADNADVRHLADCYDAIVRVTAHPEHRKLRGPYPLWSTKFYALAGAMRSFLRAGQEVVDGLLADLGNPYAARDFMERSLLPTAARSRLPEMTVPIRAHYAVICAHCADFARANEVMDALAPYSDGLPPEGRAELERQRTIVAQLQARGLSPGEAAARRRRIEAQKEDAERLRTALALGRTPTSISRASDKVGRNEQCPCGSGRKFKRCCGGAR
jgi:hypothetical protein